MRWLGYAWTAAALFFLLSVLVGVIQLVRKASVWDEPERDETTPQGIAAWIATHKHPAACDGGCQCKPEGR